MKWAVQRRHNESFVSLGRPGRYTILQLKSDSGLIELEAVTDGVYVLPRTIGTTLRRLFAPSSIPDSRFQGRTLISWRRGVSGSDESQDLVDSSRETHCILKCSVLTIGVAATIDLDH